MNRRGFLTTLFKTTGGIIVAPSIVTHGLKLRPIISDLPLALELVDNSWTAADQELYLKLPYYLAKMTLERNKTMWSDYAKMIKGNYA